MSPVGAFRPVASALLAGGGTAVPPAVLVGAGGVAGAVARHLVGRRIEGTAVDTLVVNVLGSLALGALLAAPVEGAAVAVVGTGFCGAFTTFSSFAVETVEMVERGRPRRAALYAAGTLALALAAVTLGAAAGTAVTDPWI